MTNQKRIGSSPTAQRGQASATLWTVFLGTALLGLIVLPRNRTAPPQISRPEYQAGEKLGPEDSPVSHEGVAAERLAEREADRRRKVDMPSEISAKV